DFESCMSAIPSLGLSRLFRGIIADGDRRRKFVGGWKSGRPQHENQVAKPKRQATPSLAVSRLRLCTAPPLPCSSIAAAEPYRDAHLEAVRRHHAGERGAGDGTERRHDRPADGILE